jgi:hypothetical protein
MTDVATLIKEYHTIDDFVDKETKRFSEHLKPSRARMEEIKQTIHGLLIEQKSNNISTDNGTAYIATLLTPKLTDSDAYLKWAIKNWNEGGSEMLIVGKPQVTALKNWLDTHDNTAPPGVEVSYFQRLNINRG